MSTDYLSAILAIIIAALILFIGLRTDLLREGKVANKPYSFRKFQLWVWTLVIAPCFALNWGFNYPSDPTLNPTALILLGISVATTLTAEMVASVQKNSPGIVMLKQTTVMSTSFWADILKDDEGQLSVSRLQQLIFTLIYVVIYLSMFFKDEKMAYPDFGNNAFVLIGISTGTYVIGKGLKK